MAEFGKVNGQEYPAKFKGQSHRVRRGRAAH